MFNVTLSRYIKKSAKKRKRKDQITITDFMSLYELNSMAMD